MGKIDDLVNRTGINRQLGTTVSITAVVAWLVNWAMATRENTRGVVTANTNTQLATKTWPEVKKWHNLSINAHWFTCLATSIHAKGDAEKTWRIDAIPWSEHNTEAFAGLHNKGNRVIVIFDEASAISDKIWEVTEGALTDEGTEILWFVFGNPTRNTGRFRECFGRLKHRWHHTQIDSRTVEGTNKVRLEKWVSDYGEDNDIVRVRVKGEFPRAGSTQFISSDVVSGAGKREATSTVYDPLILGIDVARFGDDESCLLFRRGNDSTTIPMQRFRGLDTMQLSARAVEAINKHKPDAVFIDETGIGGAVVDRLRQLGYVVQGVNNGGKADRKIEGWAGSNKGAECWIGMRLWLEARGAVDPISDLAQQLEGREFGYNDKMEVVLESKDDMKERGLSSPDLADALALTFAYVVAPKGGIHPRRGRVVSEYDPLA